MIQHKSLTVLMVVLAFAVSACSRDGRQQTSGSTEVCFDGGALVMGSDKHYAEEAPVKQVDVEPFCLDVVEVRVADYENFVLATGYKTVAETGPDVADYPDQPPEYFQPGAAVFVFPTAASPGYWSFNPDANWRQPLGIAQSVPMAEQHPVTQIAFKDAQQYSAWLGRRLPTEAEWEYAAKQGGLSLDEKAIDQGEVANIWNGEFPLFNSANDGYERTAPVRSYAPDENGIFDLLGNVWEWTADSYDPGNGAGAKRYVIKGGSHLCATNFCARFRPEARQPQESGLGASHIGFRTARDRPSK